MLIQSSPNLNSPEKYKAQHSCVNILISDYCIFPSIPFIFFTKYFLLKPTYGNQKHSSFCLGNILSLIWTCLQASVSACSVSVAHIPQFSRLENSTGKHPSVLEAKFLSLYLPRLPAVVLQSFVVDSYALGKCQGNLFCCSLSYIHKTPTSIARNVLPDP